MKIAIHQPAFAPWLPFFAKMHQADVFVLLTRCQFSKNGYQNRCQVNGKWWTKPVSGGLESINDKKYVDGQKLFDVNIHWILAIAKTLSIDTGKIHIDPPAKKSGTDRIIEICNHFEADKYLTNMEATEKYLDESAMVKEGIELVPFEFPYKIHTFEAFEQFGIEGTIKLLEKEKARCRV